MPTMNAIRKAGRRVALCRLDVPTPGLGEVLVRVMAAGVCRTDVLVARGALASIDPVTLGHEFAGVVEGVGRVAVLPVLPCESCAVCKGGDSINCTRRVMLGVERDGAFAEYVVVPSALVYPLPDATSFEAAAYAEPVAAALGVLNAGLSPNGRGLILGRNRFAVLIERLMRLHGFVDLTVGDGDGEYDFVIETGLEADTLSRMIDAARPGGRLVLRSRRPGAFALDALAAVRKQLTIRAVGYGAFRRALGLLVEGSSILDGLIGPAFALAEYEEVFRRAEEGEGVKLFFKSPFHSLSRS